MKSRQHGYLLLALCLALLAGSVLFASQQLSKLSLNLWAQKARSTRALNTAKHALIYRAVLEDSSPGALTCPYPDENSLNANCSGLTLNAPARLAERALGLSDVRDASDECLWIAMSPNFRSDIAANLRNASSAGREPINLDATGSLNLRPAAGESATRVIAVLMAPMHALPGQNRGAPGANGCRGGDASNFLESYVAGDFLHSGPAGSFNDQLVSITAQDLYRPLLRRLLLPFASDSSASSGLRWLLKQGAGQTPAALALSASTPPSGQQVADRLNRAAQLPDFDRQFADPDSVSLTPNGACNRVNGSYKAPASWLCYNGWYDYLEYHADALDSTAYTVSLSVPPSTRCTLSGHTGSPNNDTLSCTH